LHVSIRFNNHSGSVILIKELIKWSINCAMASNTDLLACWEDPHSVSSHPAPFREEVGS